MTMQYEKLKKEIIETCRRCVDMGYFVGTWGNISVRVPEGLIVTPSKVQYDLLTVDDFVTVSDEAAVVAGNRLPSSEAEIHRALLNCKGEVNAIIHSHSLYATAISCLQKSIPVFVEEMAQAVGGEVKCTKYVPAGQHKKIAAEVAATIGESNAVLLANHGVIGCGRDLSEAMLVCQTVEKASMIMLAAGTVGKVVPIPDEYVKPERYRYLHKYGTKSDGAVSEDGTT